MATLITDYTGRTIDAWAYAGAYTGELRADILGNEVVAGIIKLAQRWLVAFLTETNSVQFKPGYGSSFITRMKVGELRAESDIASAFMLAKQELLDLLATEESEDQPDDEKYQDCELLSVVLSSETRIDLKVRIFSVSGDSRSVLVPVRGDAI